MGPTSVPARMSPMSPGNFISFNNSGAAKMITSISPKDSTGSVIGKDILAKAQPDT